MLDPAEKARRNVETCHKVLTRVWGAGELDLCDAVFLPEFVRHDATGGDATGPAAYKALVAKTRTAFPDLQVTIDRLTPSDDTVFFRTRMTGTHGGPFEGLPASGARFVVSTQAEVVFREDGWCIEAWVISDYLTVMKAIMNAMPWWRKLLKAPTLMRLMKA